MRSSGPSSNPHTYARNSVQQLFTAAAARFGGIAPDDLPSFDQAPSGVDWVAAAQGVGFLRRFNVVVQNHIDYLPAHARRHATDLLTQPRDLFSHLATAVRDRDSNLEALAPNALLIAARSIQEQSSADCKEFGSALYQQAAAIFQAAAESRLQALPGIGLRLTFQRTAEPPRFPND